MKSNNNNAIENKLFHKILKNFTIKIIIYIVTVPLIIFIISEIISRMDFNWLYRLKIYLKLLTKCKNICYNAKACKNNKYGGLAERSKAAVLKTV